MFGLILRFLWCLISRPGFSIHGADDFFFQLVDSRICWIRGVLGGGKTSLAFMLAAFLLKLNPDDYSFVASNIPHKFPAPALQNGVNHCLVVFDEAGVFMDSRDWASNPRDIYLALRKLSTVVLAPSKNPPDKRLQELIVELSYKLGNLAWFYRWEFRLGSVFRSGEFMVFQPTAIFGLYSTGAYPPDDQGILDLFSVSLDALRGYSSGWCSYSLSSDEDHTLYNSLHSSVSKKGRL